jgi:uncharacterized Zn-binding protein involved in type VI secretion
VGAPAVTATNLMMCSFGIAPAPLNVIPSARVMIGGKPAAAITDSLTGANIPPFGMCTSVANPTVVAATAAALGVLTPMPCVPVPMPWVPGSPTVLIGGKPAVNLNCKATCAYGGVIQLMPPGTPTVLL